MTVTSAPLGMPCRGATSSVRAIKSLPAPAKWVVASDPGRGVAHTVTLRARRGCRAVGVVIEPAGPCQITCEITRRHVQALLGLDPAARFAGLFGNARTTGNSGDWDDVREAFDLTHEPHALRAEYGSHEWGQGALLAFFHGDATHVVGRDKEAAILRAHGHILRSGEPRWIDEAIVFEKPHEDGAQNPHDRGLGEIVVAPRLVRLRGPLPLARPLPFLPERRSELGNGLCHAKPVPIVENSPTPTNRCLVIRAPNRSKPRR